MIGKQGPLSIFQRCYACSAIVSSQDRVKCCGCNAVYHIRCANLSASIKKSHFYCRWVCLTNSKKKQSVERCYRVDFVKLRERVERYMEFAGDDSAVIDVCPEATASIHTKHIGKACAESSGVIHKRANLESMEIVISDEEQEPDTVSTSTSVTTTIPQNRKRSLPLAPIKAILNQIPKNSQVEQLRKLHTQKILHPVLDLHTEARLDIKSSVAHPLGAVKSSGDKERIIGSSIVHDNNAPSGKRKSLRLLWLDEHAFPKSLTQRFVCAIDAENSIFRIDLTPAFVGQKSILNQSEINFFYRCFETPRANLVIKGLTTKLDYNNWLWPFLIESCGRNTFFIFDRFLITQCADGKAELEYAGEVAMNLSTYQAYLEGYVLKKNVRDTIMVHDCSSDFTIKLRIRDNVIALSKLVIADHCSQLHSDFVKNFQWDIFAGGGHCLLQYVPQVHLQERFRSSHLHINVPGARGSLMDPGQGTTDFAYQILAGCVELVIFDRMYPTKQERLFGLLKSVGYDPKARSMLLDSQLRAVKSAGISWSTVLVYEGEFLHIHKGRLHFWRVVESQHHAKRPRTPCVFITWQWVYQGVSQRGVSSECWFAMKCNHMASNAQQYDPRRAILEAGKRGLAIIQAGVAMSIDPLKRNTRTLDSWSFAPEKLPIDMQVIQLRYEQMTMFLKSLAPCIEAILSDEYHYCNVLDDVLAIECFMHEHLRLTDVDTELWPGKFTSYNDYLCDLCGVEIMNGYKQCIGCLMETYETADAQCKTIRICFQCHAKDPSEHYAKRARNFKAIRVQPLGIVEMDDACGSNVCVACKSCTRCAACVCTCHKFFQTRYRFTSPDSLARLYADVKEIIR